jgi:hypothetical protein
MFLELKILAFEFLGVVGDFARVNGFQSLSAHSGAWHTLH